ncbi:MAG: cytidylate kinase-like family protein [Acidobacteria bacterium]|nr:MAG: cytidylate kinase-like family protein [Acidobacteriota bacterium]
MVITVSRQFGAGGSQVARQVADALGWRLIDNELIDAVAARAGLPPEEVAQREERAPSFVERLARLTAVQMPELFVAAAPVDDPIDEAKLAKITGTVVAELAAGGRCVFVGRACAAVLAQREQALHVRLVASPRYRIRLACESLGLDPGDAERTLEQTDRARERYHREYHGRDVNEATHYDMVLNTERLTLRGAAAVILGRVEELGWDRPGPLGDQAS